MRLGGFAGMMLRVRMMSVRDMRVMAGVFVCALMMQGRGLAIGLDQFVLRRVADEYAAARQRAEAGDRQIVAHRQIEEQRLLLPVFRDQADAAADGVKRRADRPLLQTADPAATIEKLIAERSPTYRQADITVASRDVADRGDFNTSLGDTPPVPKVNEA